MKQIEKLQAKARQRFGFCGSLIIHFILFVALAFSGVFAMQPPVADADTVVFFDAGGGGGGDEAVADAADDGEEQVEEVVEEETITLPDGKIEHKQVVKHVVKHVHAGAKKGSGSGSGGGTGDGTGDGYGSGNGDSGSGGGETIGIQLLSAPAPAYPESARRAGISGTTVVGMTVSTDGSVSSAWVESSSGNSTLDSAAVAAVYNWRFVPAKQNGTPVTANSRVPITFNLNG